MPQKLFDSRLNEPVSPLIDVVMNGLGMMFIMLMIYMAIASIGKTNPLQFLTGVAPPPAVIGQPFTFVLPVIGGTGERRFKVQGDLASWGLQLHEGTGTIFGTPSAVLRAEASELCVPFRVDVTDSANTSATASFAIEMNESMIPYSLGRTAIARIEPVLPMARVGEEYECVIGGIENSGASWSVSSGALPPGLELDRPGSEGAVVGKPTGAGSYEFTARLARGDGSFIYQDKPMLWPGEEAVRTFRLTVLPPIEHQLELTPARVGEPYRAAVQTGTLLEHESVEINELPKGLWSEGPIITGVPKVHGEYPVRYSIRGLGDEVSVGDAKLHILPPRPAAMVGGSHFCAWCGETARFAIPTAGLIEPIVINASELPKEVKLDRSTLIVVGAAPARHRILLSATDALGTKAQGEVTVSLLPRSKEISLPKKIVVPLLVGEPLRWRPPATGGDGPLSWSIVDGMPPDAHVADECLNMRATVPASTKTQVAVTDPMTGNAQNCHVEFRAVFPETTSIQLATTQAPLALVGRKYELALAATGGVGRATFHIEGLPPWLHATPAGLEGTPDHSGEWQIKVTAQDEMGSDGPRPLSIIAVYEAREKFAIETQSLPPAIVGVPYVITISCTGGSGSCKRVVSGILPKGLVFTASGIAGTPKESGAFELEVRATDTVLNETVSRPYRLDVVQGDRSHPLILTDAVAVGVLGHDYVAVLSATGGIGAYRWRIEGQLPPGLLFDGKRIHGSIGLSVEKREWPLLLQVEDEIGQIAKPQLIALRVSE